MAPLTLQPVSELSALAFAPISAPQASQSKHPLRIRMSLAEQSNSIPKMEPFNQSRLSRLIKEPPFLKKAEQALSDRCMRLKGEEAYDCWEALADFENIKEGYEQQCSLATPEARRSACQPLERFENMVRQSGGVSTLIQNVRMLAQTAKNKKTDQQKEEEEARPESSKIDEEKKELHFFPESGGLPKTKEELEMEESAKMPESSFTRLLKRRGLHGSSWFTPPPEHETD